MTPPAGPTESSTDLLTETLRSRFGFEAFRAGQRPLIEAVLAGRDALGVLPTGGGKSLTYQLPAALLGGISVVVSPLIALMKDQVDAFNARDNALALAIHSNLTRSEVAQVLERLKEGKVALLYVAPERLELPGYQELVARLKPRLFVIDEAHCVSHWGFDFRPSYLKLKEMVDRLRPCPILALTATATPDTRKEIVRALSLQNPLLQVASFDRPNLRFEVHPCGPQEKERRLKRLLKEKQGLGSQIVYVGRRKDADQLAQTLDEDGFGAVSYHAGLHPRQRLLAQEGWLSGRKPIAVATVAFGMGIDKPDVRAVIHYQHPASLESYYQEAGRAGRDGRPADCIILFSTKDAALAQFFLRNRYPSAEQVRAVLQDLSPEGTAPEALKILGGGDLSPEQVNVALLALKEQGLVRELPEGRLQRLAPHPHRVRLELDRLFSRKNADYRRLDAILRYCQDPACHRGTLLRYFGEALPDAYRCENCSACSGGTAATGVAAAQDEVERLWKGYGARLLAHGAVTARTLAQFLAGSKARRMPQEWRELRAFGALSHLRVAELQILAQRVLAQATFGGTEAEPVEWAVEAASQPVPGGLAGAASPENRQLSERVNYRPPIFLDGVEGMPASAIFWQTRSRTLTVGELLARQVPRQRGLHILRLFGAHPAMLSPSKAAGILRGGVGPYTRDFEEFKGNPAWGVFAELPYEEILTDLLTLMAKGYLRKERPRGKRLCLSASGQAALSKAAPTPLEGKVGQSPVPGDPRV